MQILEMAMVRCVPIRGFHITFIRAFHLLHMSWPISESITRNTQCYFHSYTTYVCVCVSLSLRQMDVITRHNNFVCFRLNGASIQTLTCYVHNFFSFDGDNQHANCRMRE